MLHRRRNYVVLPLFLFFAGCWPTTAVQGPVHSLDVKGRLVFSTSNEKHRADFRFTEYTNHWKLRLWGRFGFGRVTVTGDEQSVTVNNARGENFELDNLDDSQLKDGLDVLLSRGIRELLFLKELSDESGDVDQTFTSGRIIHHPPYRLYVEEEFRFHQWIVVKRLRMKTRELEILILVDDVQIQS